MDEDGLCGDCNDLNDSVDDEDTSGDGMVAVEYPNCDGEAAVDEDEKHPEVEEENIDRAVLLVFPLPQSLELEEGHNCRN